MLLLGAVACSDDAKVYETIGTQVCIPKSGLQQLACDPSHGACTYKLYLYKGGYNDRAITVRLEADPSVLDVYNVENGKALNLLPAKYYSFAPEVTLTHDDNMVCREIEFDLRAMVDDGVDASYVLPLSVVARDQGEVQPDKNNVIIQLILP